MFRNKVGIRGSVSWVVRDANGDIKRYDPNLLQRLFNRPGSLMQGVNHNLVTSEGDALIADMLQETPERTEMNNAGAVIGVGTGWTETVKGTDALVTQVGSSEAMDATYPVTEGDWAAADDGVVVYLSTFEAGDVTAVDLDEALLGNGTDTMAYAEINPKITVAAADTLEVTWKITFLGA